MTVYDYLNGGSSLALQRPTQPVKMRAPDASMLYLHAGEDNGQYLSFLDVVADLAQAFKFLPKYTQMKYRYGDPSVSNDPDVKAEYELALAEFPGDFGDYSKQMDPKKLELIWGQGGGVGFTNLEFSPEASDWDLVNDNVNMNDAGMAFSSPLVKLIGDNFNWDDVKAAGAGMSYYQIAKTGITCSDEQAFDLMCSMLESRERVFNSYSVFEDFSAWIADHMEVDPHNLGILRMFFGMQTDFINTVDAYINCQTYWGGDLGTPVDDPDGLGAFSADLMTKVQNYIDSLSGTQQTAANDLRSMWLTPSQRYDQVDGVWTGDLIETEESPVKFFWDAMMEVGNREVLRVVIANMMNRSEQREYREKKEKYEIDKEELKLDDMRLEKMAARRRAEAKRLVSRSVARRSSFARAIKNKFAKKTAKNPAKLIHKNALKQRQTAVAFHRKAEASVQAMKKRSQAAAAGTPGIKSRPLAANVSKPKAQSSSRPSDQNNQNNKKKQNEKKVI